MNMNWFNRDSVLSFALGFVVIWFGLGELFQPSEWVGFAPAFLGKGTLAIDLVLVHGIVLSVAGIMVIFNFYRKYAAMVLVMVFAEIVLDLIIKSGLSAIVVRDIGLWGMAIALSIDNTQTQIN